jgi:metal-dependent amidase/aminoacylase/carboxypeptidase family protein
LIETSDWMANNPEIDLQEHQASGRLAEILTEFGATVERGIAGLPTAFEASCPRASQARKSRSSPSTMPCPKSAMAAATTFGNVSHRVPAICAYLAICGPEAGWHIRDVATATRTKRGHAAIVDGAKSLAMTALDVLFDAPLCEGVKREHQDSMARIAQ